MEILSHIREAHEREDCFTLLRAMLIQGVWHNNNKRAVARIESGGYGNILQQKELPEIMLRFHNDLVLLRENAYQAMRLKLEWIEYNEKILNATDIWVFLGHMLKLYKVSTTHWQIFQ